MSSSSIDIAMDDDDMCDHPLEQGFPDEAVSTIKGIHGDGIHY